MTDFMCVFVFCFFFFFLFFFFFFLMIRRPPGSTPLYSSAASVCIRDRSYTVADGCASEDINNNGILDASDNDENGNGALEPDPSATVPMSLTTGADGTVTFDLTYLKSECSWIEVDLIATTSVQGTESQARQRFTLSCTADDLDSPAPPGGGDSPYGTATSCANPE